MRLYFLQKIGLLKKEEVQTLRNYSPLLPASNKVPLLSTGPKENTVELNFMR